MPGISRDDGQDVAGGALIQGSPNVFVNGKPVVRVRDAVAGHGRSPHAAPFMITGSQSVFTNWRSTCREGDLANCGHMASGSSDVFAD